ncbi:MAG: arginine--tRNA ligase [Bacteroidota bacterium]
MQSYLADALTRVLATLDGVPDGFEVEFQRPAQAAHGDLATNTALRLAKPLRANPRQIAQTLADGLRALPIDEDRIAAIEVAGPGFLNFRFSNRYLASGVQAILDAGTGFGKLDLGQGQRANVEYVSANPTGPLTVGHGRNAVLGDTVANLLELAGYEVTREYYFNDAGRQMRVLGQSVRSRAEALLDLSMPTKVLTFDEVEHVVPETFPEDGYVGTYIIDIAQTVVDAHGDATLEQEDETFIEAAKQSIFADIEATLARLGIQQDTYFNERTLYEDESVWNVVEQLREKDLAYDHDGAVWFKTTAYGKDKDTVLVKSSGEPTYRLPDIAYHVNKIDRGFDLLIDVFGADHIATYPDVMNGIEALGHDASMVDVIIYQFVTLIRGGEIVKMSTRKANFVTLDELIDEVGADVTRYFFLMRAPSTHLEFDLDLAKEASEKNPVFYLQYAHARICSILRKIEEVDQPLVSDPDLTGLTHPAEVDLMKVLLQFPEAIKRAATTREPHGVAMYLRDVASQFSQFYGQCHIVGEDAETAGRRLALTRATQIVLQNGLRVLGLSAPESM